MQQAIAGLCRILSGDSHTLVCNYVLGFSIFARRSTSSCRGCNISSGISDKGWGEGFITISRDQLVFVSMANPSPVSSPILPAEQQSLQGTNFKKKKKKPETKGNQKEIIFQIIALQSC